MNGGPIDCIADTSVIVGLLRGDPRIKQQISGRSFAITFITLAELRAC
jgi:predicted nucleic acid-binding protein